MFKLKGMRLMLRRLLSQRFCRFPIAHLAGNLQAKIGLFAEIFCGRHTSTPAVIESDDPVRYSQPT